MNLGSSCFCLAKDRPLRLWQSIKHYTKKATSVALFAGDSGIRILTPIRMERKRCHWWTIARTVPERLPCHIQFVFSFYILKLLGGAGKEVRLHRRVLGSQLVVKGNGPLSQQFLKVILFQLASEVWQIESTSSTSCKPLNKSIHYFLIVSLCYLILLHPIWTSYNELFSFFSFKVLFPLKPFS